jgi:transposase
MLKQKLKTLDKQVEKEQKKLEEAIAKATKKSLYSCREDAEKVAQDFIEANTKKANYHIVSYIIEEIISKATGRPAKDLSKQKLISKFKITFTLESKEGINQILFEKLRRECTFMLVSNDLGISAEELIKEYKTQSSVEVKFKQLKNDYFPNSLYVKKPERVEALMFLSLIGLQVCSLIEFVVRRELGKEEIFIRGRGNTKQYRPTFVTIIEKFDDIWSEVRIVNGKQKRVLMSGLLEDHRIILRCLGIEGKAFADTTFDSEWG